MYAPSAPTEEQEFQAYPPPPQNVQTPFIQPPQNAQNPYAQPPPPPQSPYAQPPQQIATGYPLPHQTPYAQPHQQYPPPPPPTQNASAQFVNNIYVQPPPPFHLLQGVQYDLPGLWASDIFACTEDPSNCCLTLWCPCVTFGQIAEIVDEGSTCNVRCERRNPWGALSDGVCVGRGVWSCVFSGAWLVYSCMYRTKMRAKFNLAETPCADCLVHCLCEPCALCQEYKELKYRGYDPALGWTGNLQNQQRRIGTATVPPLNQTMAR